MARVDFTSQDYLRDPATGLAKIRAAGSVVEVHFPIVGRTWITTTSDLAGRVLKDSETFRMRKNGRVAGLRWWMPGWLRALAVSSAALAHAEQLAFGRVGGERERPARELVRALGELDDKVGRIAVPLSYTDELYALRSHINLVRRQIEATGDATGLSR